MELPAKRVVEAFQARLDHMVDVSCGRVQAAEIPFYRVLPLAAQRASISRVYAAVGHDLERGEPAMFVAMLSALGTQRSAMGVAVSEILAGMGIGFDVVSEEFAAIFADDPEARIYWENARARIAYAGAAAMADSYVAAREKVVRAQAEEILRLSAQVLPLYPGVLVLPLIGRIDGERAAAITTTLLAAVARHASRVVILDISGVPVVDAEVAAHLLRAAQAIGLLGAAPLLVGVGAEVARTMVAGGVALGRLTTLADLGSGLRHALTLLGKQITDLRVR